MEPLEKPGGGLRVWFLDDCSHLLQRMAVSSYDHAARSIPVLLPSWSMHRLFWLFVQDAEDKWCIQLNSTTIYSTLMVCRWVRNSPALSLYIWPWSTKWSRAKANRVLPKERTGHSKHLPTTQEKAVHMDITRWSKSKSDWLYSLQPKMEKLYTVSKNKTWSWLWLRPWTPYCQIQT